MRSRRRGHGRSLEVDTDLKLMPLMNIIIAIIPMLLLSTVFIEVKVIETTLPRDADASAASAPAAPSEPPLDLAVHVRADAYVIEGRGVPAQVIARKFATATPDEATMTALTQRLQQIVAAHPGTKDVRIVANARTRYQEVISLMDAARAAGLSNAALEGSASEEV
jgi:biopolymer transport protein ExbD